jgi:flavodoxin I
MPKIRIFYGSSTGDTARVARLISGEMGDLVESVTSIAYAEQRDLSDAEALILGVSTWADGQLQQDWKRFLPELDEMDLSGKTVALFGLGDAQGYSGEFVTALGTLYRKVVERGGSVVGFWPAGEYRFQRSGALHGDMFVGLVIDQENEPGRTKDRVKQWAAQIRPHFENCNAAELAESADA